MEGNSASLKEEEDATDYTESPLLKNTISPHILQSIPQILQTYQSNKPYPHGVLTNIFQPTDFLQSVLHEIKHSSKVQFKESDLFKVYQSMDLGNLTDDPKSALNSSSIPNVWKLKQVLYSSEFRHLMEDVTNLPRGTLTDEIDCAANCHTKGCHLLCHDDVIGTRKISFIIYLTDPSWTKEDGGALELYNHKDGIPNVFPSTTILPTYNSLAYFGVNAGVSFHAVQEVMGRECGPRLSLQGWYHGRELPENMECATLSRLKTLEEYKEPFVPFIDTEIKETETEGKLDETQTSVNDKKARTNVLSESDRNYLSQYMNETYLTESSMKEICDKFENESSVQLRHFLKDVLANNVKDGILKSDAFDGFTSNNSDENDNVGNPSLQYDIGINKCWKAVGPAHKQRYLEYNDEHISVKVDPIKTSVKGSNPFNEQKVEKTNNNHPSIVAGKQLSQIQTSLFQSLPFTRYLNLITSLGQPLGHHSQTRRFRPGLDYTVAHYGILTKESVLDATLCFAKGSGNQARRYEDTGELMGNDEDVDALWESGDVGGFECYIAADDDSDSEAEDEDEKQARPADAEYNAEDDSELLSVSVSDNTLSLVYRDTGTMRFVKYVASGAPSSRWDINVEYQLPEDDDDSNNGEDDNNDNEEDENSNENYDADQI